MNKTECQIVNALTKVRTVPNLWDVRFIKSLSWLARHEPETSLSGTQRYQLQLQSYRYRRQLAGLLDEELIPVEEPIESDYVREFLPLQRDMF